MGPARRGASSLLGPEGFFLGKMGFREAVAAGDVSLSQVRKRGCRRRTPPTEAPPQGYPDASEREQTLEACWISTLEQSHAVIGRGSLQ